MAAALTALPDAWLSLSPAELSSPSVWCEVLVGAGTDGMGGRVEPLEGVVVVEAGVAGVEVGVVVEGVAPGAWGCVVSLAELLRGETKWTV